MPTVLPNIPAPVPAPPPIAPPPPAAKPSGFLARIKSFFLVILNAAKNLFIVILSKAKNLFSAIRSKFNQSKSFRIVSLAIAILLVIGGATYYIYSTAPIRLAKKQINLLKEDKVEDAYKLTSPEFQGAMTLSQFQKMMQEIPNIKDAKKVKISEKYNIVIDDTKMAVAHITVTTKDNNIFIETVLKPTGFLKFEVWSLEIAK